MAARSLLADAFYWVALIFPRDSQHARVLSFSQSLGIAHIFTTDEVLTRHSRNQIELARTSSATDRVGACAMREQSCQLTTG
jgi:hypothetical protein